jgi:polygalacturonase
VVVHHRALRRDRVAIRNVKICGSRVDNDDGIDLINSSDVTI